MSKNVFEATVIKQIDKHTLVINKGYEDGVTKDDIFLIYSLGEVLHDPRTGIELGRLEIVHGKGSVEHIQRKITTLISCTFIEQPTKKIIRKPSPLYSPYLIGDSSTVEESFDPPVRKAFSDLAVDLDTEKYFARRVE